MAKQYRLKEMQSRYRGENVKRTSIWGSAVEYLSKRERQAYRLEFRDGKVYDASGKLFDTTDAFTVFSSEGRAIFVMDENGDFYASKIQEVGRFHHSSLSGGEPVAAAGEIVVERGVLKLISNKSGHYRPEPYFMQQALEALARKRVELSGVKRDFV